METKLFSIILCLLALEATGSSLKNLTSIQHGTENASARSAPISQPPPVVRFDFDAYGTLIFTIIYNRILVAEKRNQFAFLMIVRSEAKRFEVPGNLANLLQSTNYLPSLKTDGVYPPNARSNLVIAGVGKKPRGASELAYHAEKKLINSMPTMDRYYDEAYGLICPWLIMLGSAYDTCCGCSIRGYQKCAQRFVAEKEKYVRQTTCTNIIWFVYVGEVRKWSDWQQALLLYTRNNIKTFALLI
ncbi:Hypothetical predicted protein [Paramuricea clavata]|uniref:Uncharacterized protein n=1 Tax=Paramuricea clavata TaxID=317549 RepID=A0A6S7IYJ5_PARCT|nr:Hypothetical predicted protein [Paramuricea clavata]